MPTHEVNIWADPSAAAVVRGYADGNETVPTVVVGDHGYVNPPAATVLAELRRAVPDFTPDPELARSGRRLSMLHQIRWAVVAALLLAGVAMGAAGQPILGLAMVGVAAVVYVASRPAAARMGPPSRS